MCQIARRYFNGQTLSSSFEDVKRQGLLSHNKNFNTYVFCEACLYLANETSLALREIALWPIDSSIELLNQH